MKAIYWTIGIGTAGFAAWLLYKGIRKQQSMSTYSIPTPIGWDIKKVDSSSALLATAIRDDGSTECRRITHGRLPDLLRKELAVMFGESVDLKDDTRCIFYECPLPGGNPSYYMQRLNPGYRTAPMWYRATARNG